MYISAAQLQAQLPDLGGDLTTSEVQEHIDFWKAELIRVNRGSELPEETNLTRRIVRDGAYADALEDMLERDGIFEHPSVQSRRERALKNLEAFDSMNTTDDEVAKEQYPVVISDAPFYATGGSSPEEHER